jgi:hypothetical protein
MKIIEQQLLGKHLKNDCEDGIVVTPDFVAVIDGSTSKTEHRFNPEMKNGRYCMMLIAGFIREMKSDISLDKFCREITAHVFKSYSSDRLDTSGRTVTLNQSDLPDIIPPHERLCASAVIYSNHHRQIWMIGDCQCMINGKLYENPKPYEERLAALRAKAFDNCCRKKNNMVNGMAIVHDYARDMILPELVQAMQNQNKTYAVIDGYPIFKNGIRNIEVGKGDCEIVLASDGYPFLMPTLEESEKALQKQLATDPFNIRTFKATKGLMEGNRSFDDRAYVRFCC